jgi:hypothetical protein
MYLENFSLDLEDPYDDDDDDDDDCKWVWDFYQSQCT